MNSRDFCYWLMGLLEVGNPKSLDERQIRLIKRHLDMVFYHEIDPSFEDKEELNKIHQGDSQGDELDYDKIAEGLGAKRGEPFFSKKFSRKSSESIEKESEKTKIDLVKILTDTELKEAVKKADKDLEKVEQDLFKSLTGEEFEEMCKKTEQELTPEKIEELLEKGAQEAKQARQNWNRPSPPKYKVNPSACNCPKFCVHHTRITC